MLNYELFTKRATLELERVFHIQPYSDDLVVPLGSWQASHNREATENLIRRNRKSILELGDEFDEAMKYLIALLEQLFMNK